MKECDLFMRGRANRVGELPPAALLFSSFGKRPKPTFFHYSLEFERYYLQESEKEL
jgi:hypothetical protein